MSPPLRVGAVSYLNARPLVRGLDKDPRFAVRFDLPATCAVLLHEGSTDVGLVPSIEYLARPDYRIVPDAGVVSHGPVASVALFTRERLDRVRSIALDSGSRTSVTLLKVLCRSCFGIAPRFEVRSPNLSRMLETCDAALLIGDVALFVDHGASGLQKIDLGEEWTRWTGLPFVYAAWVGRDGALDQEAVRALQQARLAGEAARDDIAREHFRHEPDKIDRAIAYLRENIQYRIGEAERTGLVRFFEIAAAQGLVERTADLRYY